MLFINTILFLITNNNYYFMKMARASFLNIEILLIITEANLLYIRYIS